MTPPSPPNARPGTIGQALQEAVRALDRQRPDEAERLASGVLRGDRGNVHAAHILGTALLMQARPEEAIETLQRIAKRSGEPALETLLARALAAAGRTEEALGQLRQTTERRPPYPAAFLELGVGLGDLGRTEDGVTVLEAGLALTPDADGLRIGLGYLHLKRNDRIAARRAFQQVHDAAPNRPDAMVGLAKTVAAEGEYAEAAELYDRALAARPDDASLRIELGKCLLETGQRDMGEAALRATVRGAPAQAGAALTALAATPHGRAFLSPSAAVKFLSA